jgi:hypothetical protein
MSAWYSLSGTVRVRRCHAVEAIIAVIRSHCGRHFAFDVDVIPVDSETDEFSTRGLPNLPQRASSNLIR